MAKRGGFGGGMMPGNINQLMKQAQKMPEQGFQRRNGALLLAH